MDYIIVQHRNLFVYFELVGGTRGIIIIENREGMFPGHYSRDKEHLIYIYIA